MRGNNIVFFKSSEESWNTLKYYSQEKDVLLILMPYLCYQSVCIWAAVSGIQLTVLLPEVQLPLNYYSGHVQH